MKADTGNRRKKNGGSRKLINRKKDEAGKYGMGTGTLLNFWVPYRLTYDIGTVPGKRMAS
jgi:hypothetical protein